MMVQVIEEVLIDREKHIFLFLPPKFPNIHNSLSRYIATTPFCQTQELSKTIQENLSKNICFHFPLRCRHILNVPDPVLQATSHLCVFENSFQSLTA